MPLYSPPASSGIAATLVDAKGDVLVGTADDTIARKAVGSDGTLLAADSNASDGLRYIQAGVSPGHATGYWQTAQWQRASGGFTLVDQTAYALPFYVAKRTTYDRITAYVLTAGTGGTPVVRLGVYADSSGSPGALSFDGSTVTAASTGQKDITISQTLGQGWYWLVCVAQGATTTQPQMLAARATDGPGGGWSGQAPGTNNFGSSVAYNCWKKSSISGALPDPLGAVSGADFQCPVVFLRAA